MTDQTLRVALANLPFPRSPEHSLELAEQAVGEAAASLAEIVCFAECFIPGYRAQAAADRAGLTLARCAGASAPRQPHLFGGFVPRRV